MVNPSLCCFSTTQQNLRTLVYSRRNLSLRSKPLRNKIRSLETAKHFLRNILCRADESQNIGLDEKKRILCISVGGKGVGGWRSPEGARRKGQPLRDQRPPAKTPSQWPRWRGGSPAVTWGRAAGPAGWTLRGRLSWPVGPPGQESLRALASHPAVWWGGGQDPHSAPAG